MTTLHSFEIQTQPTDTDCGPTCLQAVYSYYNDPVELADVIREIPQFAEGGTIAVFLACHALRRGYKARIYTYNLEVFDPTWFTKKGAGKKETIARRLKDQMKHKRSPRLRIATRGYLEFLKAGGELHFEDLNAPLLRRFLRRKHPILVGLSATYLYHCSREAGGIVMDYDDVRGTPMGHFVVLYGYRPKSRKVLVADPLHPNPYFPDQRYATTMDRVIGAIFLGCMTHDANILIIEPGEGSTHNSDAHSNRR